MLDLTDREYRIMFRLAYESALAKAAGMQERIDYYADPNRRATRVPFPHPDYLKHTSAIDVLSDPARHVEQDLKHCKEWLATYTNIAKSLEEFLAKVRDADDAAWIEGIREYLNRSKL